MNIISIRYVITAREKLTTSHKDSKQILDFVSFFFTNKISHCWSNNK